MATDNTMSYSQFQFIVLLIEVFGEKLKKIHIDQQHTIAFQLFTAWDNYDELFRDSYAYPMNDLESIQQWFDENKPKIEALIQSTSESM